MVVELDKIDLKKFDENGEHVHRRSVASCEPFWILNEFTGKPSQVAKGCVSVSVVLKESGKLVALRAAIYTNLCCFGF